MPTYEVDNYEATLLDLAMQIGTILHAPSRPIYAEAVYQSLSSPCSAKEILDGWLATAQKGGKPRQIAQWAGRAG